MVERVNRAWSDNTDLIRQYIEQTALYEQLNLEVEYCLRQACEQADFPYAAITSRVKSLESFLEKIDRKKYANPLDDVTDISGVRIVYLYKDDLVQLDEIVTRLFNCLDRVDKQSEFALNEFGYSAVHYNARLGDQHSGARYDSIKCVTFELQARTVMQDAWAIMQHHLAYKSEHLMHDEFLRHMHAIAGNFLSVDAQFQNLRESRLRFEGSLIDRLSDPQQRNAALESDTNVDTLTAYLRWQFPNVPLCKSPATLGVIASDLDPTAYPKLEEIHHAISSTKDLRNVLRKNVEGTWLVDDQVPATAELAWALGIVDEAFRRQQRFPVALRLRIEELMPEESH